MNSTAQRILLSLLIFLHLSVIVLTPNRSSYLYLSLAMFMDPYSKTLAINHNWGFFAPEPVAPPTHIEYSIERQDQLPEKGRFPLEGDPYFFRERQNRMMTLTRFMLNKDDYLRNMLIRYLCLTTPGATVVKAWKVVGYTPSLDLVRSGQKRMTDPVDWKIDPLGDFYCPEEK